MGSLPLVIIRRFLAACIFAILQYFWFGHMAFGPLLWFLPGVLVYLIRFWFCYGESEAAGIGDVHFNQFIHMSSYALIAVFLLGLMWYKRRGGNRVRSITATPPSVPSTAVGNPQLGFVKVMPDNSPDADEAVSLSHESAASSHDALQADEEKRDHEEAMEGTVVSVSPHAVEGIGGQAKHHTVNSGFGTLQDSCGTDWECSSASHSLVSWSLSESHADTWSISACSNETLPCFISPNIGLGSTSRETQTKLTWNGCMLSCSDCSMPPVLHPSLNGVWYMCPVLPGTPFWMRILGIRDLEFRDANERIGSLDMVHGQVYLEGGSLQLLPNGMLQRTSRNSGVSRTFLRLLDLSAARGLGFFHNEEGEDARHETHPTEDDDMPNEMATQTSEVTHYYCVCSAPAAV